MNHVMRIKAFLITILAISSIIVYGQNKIQGYVLDKQTNEPLSYTIISEIHQKYGSYSDTAGMFTLFFLSENDSLKVSNLGYSNINICVRDLLKTAKVLLEPDPFQLQEVVVNSQKTKTKFMEIGFSTKKTNLFIVASYSQNINSIFIPFPEKGSIVLIKSVRFTYTLATRNFPLRVRIISVGTNGEPGDDIVAENIVFSNYKEGRKQVAVVDITKYNVYMPRNGVFITLEWIMDKAPVTLEQAFQNGPYIGATKTANPDNSLWINAYNNSKWIEMHRAYILAIGLTVGNYSK